MDSSRTPIQRLPMNRRNDDLAPGSRTVNLITGIILLRVWNALSLQTFFQPDEYFQSLEPAWALAFGRDSGAWLTWEWRERLRSSIHPILFAGLYKGMDYLCERLKYGPAERAMLLITAPRFLQGILAAVMDIFSYRLACKIFGDRSHQASAVLLLTVVSPWQWFCSTRTLSNCLEATLTVIALDLFPWAWLLASEHSVDSGKKNDEQRKLQSGTSVRQSSPPGSLYAGLLSAALGCILRPTNGVIWAFISLGLSIWAPDKTKMVQLVKVAIISGSAMLTLSVCTDRWFYGDWVFPPWEFLQFNVVQSLSGFYGINRPLYYFTEAFILLLMAVAPFALYGLIPGYMHMEKNAKSTVRLVERRILLTFITTIFLSSMAFSLLAHKEVRFIYPLLPMMHILAAWPLVIFCEPLWKGTKLWRGVLLGLGLAVNLGVGYYGSYIHQRGVLDVMHYLRHERELHYTGPESNMTVGFLMPCHSTPWRSHFIYPDIEAWALTCEPPLNLSKEQRMDYFDEADIFYADPTLWLDRNMAREGERREEYQRMWPEYVVFFEQLEPTIQKALGGTEYGECWRTFNTHLHDDWRRAGDVVVWCTRNAATR